MKNWKPIYKFLKEYPEQQDFKNFLVKKEYDFLDDEENFKTTVVWTQVAKFSHYKNAWYLSLNGIANLYGPTALLQLTTPTHYKEL